MPCSCSTQSGRLTNAADAPITMGRRISSRSGSNAAIRTTVVTIAMSSWRDTKRQYGARRNGIRSKSGAANAAQSFRFGSTWIAIMRVPRAAPLLTRNAKTITTFILRRSSGLALIRFASFCSIGPFVFHWMSFAPRGTVIEGDN